MSAKLVSSVWNRLSPESQQRLAKKVQTPWPASSSLLLLVTVLSFIYVYMYKELTGPDEMLMLMSMFTQQKLYIWGAIIGLSLAGIALNQLIQSLRREQPFERLSRLSNFIMLAFLAGIWMPPFIDWVNQQQVMTEQARTVEVTGFIPQRLEATGKYSQDWSRYAYLDLSGPDWDDTLQIRIRTLSDSEAECPWIHKLQPGTKLQLRLLKGRMGRSQIKEIRQLNPKASEKLTAKEAAVPCFYSGWLRF